jgi:DNA polymerase V
VLGDMRSADSHQAEFFDDGRAERASRLLRTVDRVNASLGEGTLRYGGEQTSRAWTPLREHRSPRWTTNWDELPSARV